MRVNPNPLPDLLSAVSQTQQLINQDLEQISSGQTINTPSDNPAGAAMLVRNAGQSAEADQFLRSASGVAGELQNADSALNSVVTSLQRAISLGVEGANGTLNDSDRAAIAVRFRESNRTWSTLPISPIRGNSFSRALPRRRPLTFSTQPAPPACAMPETRPSIRSRSVITWPSRPTCPVRSCFPAMGPTCFRRSRIL